MESGRGKRPCIQVRLTFGNAQLLEAMEAPLTCFDQGSFHAQFLLVRRLISDLTIEYQRTVACVSYSLRSAEYA
jgi:hypothetical protein